MQAYNKQISIFWPDQSIGVPRRLYTKPSQNKTKTKIGNKSTETNEKPQEVRGA